LDLMARVLLLAYGGSALISWIHIRLLGNGDTTLDPLRWLRDGTLSVPIAFLLTLVVTRRSADASTQTNATIAVYYGTLMGAATAVGGLYPEGDHAAHEGAASDTLTLLLHIGIVAVAAAAYSLISGFAFDASASDKRIQTSFGITFKMPTSRLTRVSMIAGVTALLVLSSSVLNASPVAAQTSFPDQAIHPKGTLTLVAQTLSDGSLAFVAPDYGANGVRPIIEMTEGETLNITLKNQLTVDVSLHVHGVHYNLDSDGTRHSNSFVKAGQQRVYQWRAAVGTSGYWHYHDHVVGDDEGTEGIQRGLYGALVVRKPGDLKPAHTFVVVGQDRTLNGRVYPDTITYTARQGELVEWVVISHGNRVHNFHLHGHRWLTPNRTSDPNPSLPANIGSGHEDTHILSPGDSFGFLVIAGDDVGPGMWMYHCHFQDHSASMKGFFNVLPAAAGAATETSHTFPETGKTVSGRFWEYWQQNGGLAQQGFPLTDEFQEKSDLDGKTYTVQYFERSVFEKHPENPKPYDVLLSQLGTFRYKEKYPNQPK
ncbi:MAG: multicopper oxidase domain-containing protein, partial [Chloroflexia bacterium]